MSKKLKIAVLAGGSSSERAISLITGKAIFENLNHKKYEPFWVEMTKDNKFELKTKTGKRFLDLQNKDRRFFGCIFIALHGTPGEDGTVQGMLELLGIPYTGPKTLASALSMNKVFTSQIYKMNGFNTPQFEHITRQGWKKYRQKALAAVKKKIGFPCVVKPVDQGSAVGVSIVKKEKDLPKILDKTFKRFNWLMAQKFIAGAEATCGILETKNKKIALPPTHILPVLGEFYDYKAKYAKGGSNHICPADFSKKINETLQKLAQRAHAALRCSGMSRTDFIVSNKVLKSGRVKIKKNMKPSGAETGAPLFTPDIYLLETNTIPGMTPVSLLPEAAGKMGIDFPKMLDLIIKAAI